MPTAQVNGIDINYQLEGDGAENDRADQRARRRPGDLGLQMPALVDAGYRVLRFDNRGVGAVDEAAGAVHDRAARRRRQGAGRPASASPTST